MMEVLISPIIQALAPCLAVGCCMVIGLVPRILSMGSSDIYLCLNARTRSIRRALSLTPPCPPGILSIEEKVYIYIDTHAKVPATSVCIG